MKKVSKVLVVFATTYFLLMTLSYLVITLVPIFAAAFGVIYAACQSGNFLYLFVSVWLIPALIALFTCPFIIDYINLIKYKKSREDEDAEEMDADR